MVGSAGRSVGSLVGCVEQIVAGVLKKCSLEPKEREEPILIHKWCCACSPSLLDGGLLECRSLRRTPLEYGWSSSSRGIE